MISLKKFLAIMLCVSMVLGSTLTAFTADDLEITDNQEKQEEVLESSESFSFDVEEEPAEDEVEENLEEESNNDNAEENIEEETDKIEEELEESEEDHEETEGEIEETEKEQEEQEEDVE